MDGNSRKRGDRLAEYHPDRDYDGAVIRNDYKLPLLLNEMPRTPVVPAEEQVYFAGPVSHSAAVGT